MHKLKLVTITGADDRVDPKDLHALSQEYPFVEWGLLLSRTRTGLEPRYPSLKWLSEVSALQINKSVHVCGQLARASMLQRDQVLVTALTLAGGVSRIQLNISPYLKDCTEVMFPLLESAAAKQGIQVIVQVPSFERSSITIPALAQYQDVRGHRLGSPDKSRNPAITILHDASGGRGIAGGFSVPPKGWILPGFAGGITPDNVGAKLDEIYMMEGDFAEFWIDMESGVRTDNQLDLDKVRRVLSICKDFMRSGPFDKTLIQEDPL